MSGVSGDVTCAGMCLQVSGHPAIAPHMDKFYGIRNGIDQDIWDPITDRFLPRRATFNFLYTLIHLTLQLELSNVLLINVGIAEY